MSESEASSPFAELGLPRPLVSGLRRSGMTEPFAIQRACIPDVLAGRDVLGRAQTGSGKTLAFGLPLLASVAGESAAPRRPRALIVVPTRELALQVTDALEPLGRGLSVRVRPVIGGAAMSRQVANLRRGVEVIVATPGRLTDLLERGECRLDDVAVTVIDEADLMSDMGFLPAITALLDRVPTGGQRMLFSATLDGEVDTIVRRYLVDPVTHAVDPPSAPVETMDHHLLLVAPADKMDVTTEIAGRDGRTILFVRTKHAADRLAGKLARVGVRAGTLHGGKKQGARTRTLAAFKDGTVAVLVATDVAARGIHVDGVSLVLHVDPPADPKDYLHRAGRTARAGESGTVATLVLPHQVRATARMVRKAGVSAGQSTVRAGDPELVKVTGARAPSGIPVPPEPFGERQDRGDRRRGGPTGRPRGSGRPGGRGPAGPREDRHGGMRGDRPGASRRGEDRRQDGERRDGQYRDGQRSDRPYRDGQRRDRPYRDGRRGDGPRGTARPRGANRGRPAARTDGRARPRATD